MTAELKHFGILGMKWGVRRYQNEDGTLTKAGKKRYSKNLEYRDKLAEKASKNADSNKRRARNIKEGIKDLKKHGVESDRYKQYVDEQVQDRIDKAKGERDEARSAYDREEELRNFRNDARERRRMYDDDEILRKYESAEETLSRHERKERELKELHDQRKADKEKTEFRRELYDEIAALGIEAATRAYYSKADVAAKTIEQIIKDDNNEAGNYYRRARDWAKRSESLRTMEVTALNKKEIKNTYKTSQRG